MLRREIEEGLFEFCSKHAIGIIVYSPMERGLLTGKFSKERIRKLPKNDHRRNASPFLEPELSANLELVDRLKTIAEQYGKTQAQLAIAWVLRRREVTAAIVGARYPSQIDENIGGIGWNLSEDTEARIDELLRMRHEGL